MDITNVLAAVPVNDSERSVDWYSALLGREPDARPMDGLAEWHFARGHTVQVAEDAGRAGGGMMTLQVSDIAAARSAAESRGIVFDYDDTTSDDFEFAELEDPDGNAVAVVAVRDSA